MKEESLSNKMIDQQFASLKKIDGEIAETEKNKKKLKKKIASESAAEDYKRSASFSSSSLSEKSRKLIRLKIFSVFSEKNIRELYEYETA
jgi:hypothetical protein